MALDVDLSIYLLEQGLFSHILIFVKCIVFKCGTITNHAPTAPSSSQDDETAGISLSPPFALGIEINSDDIIACGIATGHVWVGYGGSKKASSAQGKRKSRKWNGLNAADGRWLKAGNGPIVAVYVLLRCLPHSPIFPSEPSIRLTRRI